MAANRQCLGYKDHALQAVEVLSLPTRGRFHEVAAVQDKIHVYRCIAAILTWLATGSGALVITSVLESRTRLQALDGGVQRIRMASSCTGMTAG